MNTKLMIYGAAGYAGELMAREAVIKGIKPILAGRIKNKPQIDVLALELGLETRYFSVEESHKNLTGIKVLLNCAGPFSATTAALAEACLLQKVHYLDITGEIDVFQHCHQLSSRAEDSGVIIMPGVGFDIVPTDCLAMMLKERMPDADRIDLAFSFGTQPSIGTAKTMIEGIGKGGVIRRNYKLEMVANAFRSRKIPFQNGDKWSVSIPWGDVLTSGISTGVPNCMVYIVT